ncbi:MAG: metal-sensing transcriptional repressor [bacterium]|nr:metal-sensing transcriptional repressor [bacterium]
MTKEEHVQESGHVHTHMDEHGKLHTHTHSHGHNHPNAKAVSNRLARAIGHLEVVKRMVDDGEDCAEVLIQLAAVRSAINNAGKVLLMDHINHCIVEAVQEGDQAKIDELNEAIRKFIK